MALAELVFGSQLLGGWMQNQISQKNLERQLQLLREQFAPELAARSALMTRLGKEEPRLAAEFIRERQKTRQTVGSQAARLRAEGRRTGVSREADVRRLEMMGREVEAEGALSYAAKQREQKDRVIQALLGRGMAGPVMADVMERMRGAEEGAWGNVASAAGGYMGAKVSAPLLEAMRDFYASAAEKPTTPTTEAAAPPPETIRVTAPPYLPRQRLGLADYEIENPLTIAPEVEVPGARLPQQYYDWLEEHPELNTWGLGKPVRWGTRGLVPRVPRMSLSL